MMGLFSKASGLRLEGPLFILDIMAAIPGIRVYSGADSGLGSRLSSEKRKNTNVNYITDGEHI